VRSASITYMIRHYVARRAGVTEGHPYNAAMWAPTGPGAHGPNRSRSDTLPDLPEVIISVR